MSRSSLPLLLWIGLAACSGGAPADADADADGFLAPDDCDDADASVHPGAGEVPYDGVDNDCDPAATPDEDRDGDGATVADDCDDADPAVHPGAEERCDGVDDDCDRVVDDAPTDGLDGWADLDGDGHGDAEAPGRFCADATGWSADADDCDDAEATAHPGAQEACDAVDDDCDGQIDEDPTDAPTWYADADADGYGAAAAAVVACAPPDAFVARDGDCDDGDSLVFPGATERDDLADQDCDGAVDEDFVRAGDLVITEIVRAPNFGAASPDPTGAWFELVNVSSRAVDLAGWRVAREDASSSATFRVDPARAPLLDPGARAVFCRSDAHDTASDPVSALACDYVWADDDASFALDAADATLALRVGGDDAALVDAVTWGPEWPSDDRAALSLDPALTSAAANDEDGAWCPSAEGSVWWSDGAVRLLGTPGAANAPCP